MAHFCWLLKFGFLLLMLSGCRTRPAPAPAPFPGGRQSELIAGNEFLKLFLDHDDQQRSLHSSEQDFEGRGESPSNPNPRQRMATGRSLDVGRNRYRNSLTSGNTPDDEQDSKQVVKLVTSGSKIVFLEDAPNKNKDEVKVVAVSVSSSSKRGGPSSPPSGATGSGMDFVNRSHKSELSIEETEPRLAGDSMDSEVDSLNSASNIQSVLAAPLLAASSAHSFLKGNQSEVETGEETVSGLPFQTVIYHDTKHGSRGPQSRSISYSSISQNVDDLQTWQQTRSGILAEAQRNVSESLKHGHGSSEPSKFYSLPSKMYSVPSKFYSEPAKVYSEPSKMYGQPEKVYSEPAKVYGQPSKFYSEPAKVYSQPSKVYGEPAKTYWPQTLTTTTAATSLESTTTVQSSSSSSTTEKPLVSSTFVPLRSRPRPAIVSRIAFGEAQSTAATSSSTAATPSSTAATLASRVTTVKPPVSTTTTSIRPTTWQHHYHSYSHQQQQQPTRRVLFNLDKLPYDLLNAPQPLDPILSKHSGPSHYHQQQQQQQQHLQQQHEQQQQQHPSPCWEQQRQHSSPPHQHSNQNAKGLPNRDLVKCVSKFAHQHGAAGSAVDPSAPSTSGSGGGYSYSSSSSSSTSSSSSSAGSSAGKQQHQHFTTERPELYTPTSEQNYEIEESVSVMTNGRAHGLQGGGAAGGAGGAGSAATTPAGPVQANPPSSTTVATTNRGINRGRGSVVYNANANDYSDDDNGGDSGDSGDSTGEGQTPSDDEDKVAYVVEGRNYRKYRVEEKTDDGFIVGEYGVVDHNDGNLWGVRYTADSTINRSLIQKALLTFLKLK